jgi:predicted SnoaL-like aldol condensation-catalyzing enzyme
MIESTHPNLTILMKLDLQDLDASTDILADDFIWHYFNPKLPDLEGDYRGIEGLKGFFAKVGEMSRGRFQVNRIDLRAVGDELLVTQVCNRITLGDVAIEFDAVVVWRVVDGKLAEAWDIPSVYKVRTV